MVAFACSVGVARVQERQDPHLRWSQAPPRPWRRPGSADMDDWFNGHFMEISRPIYGDFPIVPQLNPFCLQIWLVLGVLRCKC